MIRRRSRTGTRTTPERASATHRPRCVGWPAGGADGGENVRGTSCRAVCTRHRACLHCDRSRAASGRLMDTATAFAVTTTEHLHLLQQLEKKLLWLSSWMIHNANHIRPNRDGLKVGGHQASCASVISIMTALYFEIA